MSDVAITAAARGGGDSTAPGRRSLSHRVQRIGYVILGLQLVGFLAWSTILYRRYAVESDFGFYNQAWFLIAHGDLNPYSTIFGVWFWQNDSEFLIWLLAPLYWIAHGGLVLLWLQDISVVGAEVVAFTWICNTARHRCKDTDAAWLAGLGLVLLVADPWVWWSVSFDLHQEPLIMVFVVLLAWDLARGRRRAWVWTAPVLLSSAATATYLIGLGLGGALTGGRSRRLGAGIAALGLGWSLFVVVIHGDVVVSLPVEYGYLAAGTGRAPVGLTISGLLMSAASHPLRVLQPLWAKRVNMIANLAPAGLLGLGMWIILPLMVVVILANWLWPGLAFAEPIYQNMPIYVFLPVGSVAVLCWLIQRHRKTAFAVMGLITLQALGWAAVWVPQTPGEWLRVPAPMAATLADIQTRIPASAEVIASEGIVGRFCDRREVYPFGLFDASTIPVSSTTWFVITPSAGIQGVSTATSMALIGELAGPLHASLITRANGVWVFRWTPPPGVQNLVVPADPTALPGWTAAGAAGLSMTSGPPSKWRVSATGARGYVADGLEWLDQPGRYLASVTLSAAAPVNVEVWDDTTDTLLTRRTIAPTQGVEQVTMPVDAPHAPNATVYSGWGPFRAQFRPAPPGQRLEVRVWSPGEVAVNVYSAYLTAAPR